MSTSGEHRTSLRLPEDQYDMIDQLCHADGGKITMSAWIAEAIEEKIARDTGCHPAQPNHPARIGRRFYEFFSGGGMARAGLGDRWDCLFANDVNPMKGRVYRENWSGGADLLVEDINNITSKQLPDQADLVWASFPCQDLSLAGGYKGMGHHRDQTQTRSGTFWPFWQLMRDLMDEDRAPALIVLENVYGVMTANQGKDFAAIGAMFAEAGYRFGAMVIDARLFVPQSRPRVFIVGVHSKMEIPQALLTDAPVEPWHPARLRQAYNGLSKTSKEAWIWWNLPLPAARAMHFSDLIDDHPTGVKWDHSDKTEQLLAMMSPTNRQKVNAAQHSGKRMVGGLYKRTRQDENGHKVQRAEVRFDDIAGCLRTPSGGSSRQSILVVEGSKIRSRLLSPREAARLMGLPDSYQLPTNYNDAYHVCGDGVVVAVVRHLAQSIFEPILSKVGNVLSFHQKVA